MNMRETIEARYKEAIKAKNNNEVNTLRLIKSAIKDKDIASRTSDNSQEINEEEILLLLQTLIKQRKDSIESFEKASRKDLVEVEKKEIEIISSFLPNQLNENEIKEIVIKIIKENKLSSIKDMGSLMKVLKENYSGKIDMAVAGKLAKLNLNN